MVDRCMRTDSSNCDPSRRSRVMRLGSQLEESFLIHLSTIGFSLNTDLGRDTLQRGVCWYLYVVLIPCGRTHASLGTYLKHCQTLSLMPPSTTRPLTTSRGYSLSHIGQTYITPKTHEMQDIYFIISLWRLKIKSDKQFWMLLILS